MAEFCQLMYRIDLEGIKIDHPLGKVMGTSTQPFKQAAISSRF